MSNVRWVHLASTASALVVSATSQARPYLTLRDDGSVAGFNESTSPSSELARDLMTIYQASGAPLPNVISVWTTFDFDGNSTETLTLPLSNDIHNNGMASVYGGNGIFSSPYPPVQDILFHNNILQLAERASADRAPAQDYAQYLFLLEISHKWIGDLQVPGSLPNELVGFTFHWSFWLNSGGSPAGGNSWQSNGDGGFATIPRMPDQLQYSPLDLYEMGLIPPTSVPPFTVLENAVPPPTPTDPFDAQPYSAASFPDFDSTPLTVQATSRAWTIDDITSVNGVRSPASGDSPTNWTLGIVLLVGATSTDSDVASAQAFFDPIASTLVPAFTRATGGLGTLTLLTEEDDTDGGLDSGVSDAGSADDGGAGDAGTGNFGGDDGGSSRSHGASGCSSGGGMGAGMALAAASVLVASRRRRTRPRQSHSRRPGS